MEMKAMRRQSGVRGSTLIEIMIAAGIGMGLVLAIMTAIQSANQSVKSSGLSNDWTTLIMGIRETYADNSQCNMQFGGMTFPTGAGGDLTNSNASLALGALNVKNPANGAIVGLPLLSTTQIVNNLKATTLQLVVSPGNQTQQILYGGAQSFLDHVELNIVATKLNADGTTLTGGNTVLQSNQAHNNPIRFNVIRNSTAPYAIASCYGLNDAAQQACNEMGGSYPPVGTVATPKCEMPRIFFGTDRQLSTPGTGAPNQGQRVQLWSYSGVQGVQDPRDYAIGMDGATMWLNAGESPNNQILMTNNAGNNPLLSVGPSGTTVDSQGGNVPHQVYGYVIAGNGAAGWWVYLDSTHSPGAYSNSVGTWKNFFMPWDCGANAVALSHTCACSCNNNVCTIDTDTISTVHSGACNCNTTPAGGLMTVSISVMCALY